MVGQYFSDGGPITVVIILWKKTCKQWNMMKYVTSFMGIFVLPKQATTSSQKSFQIWFTCLAGRTSCWGAELTWRHHLFAEKPLTERGLFITLPEFHLAQIWRKFTNRKSLTWQEGRPDGNNRWRLCSFCFMHHVMSFHRFHRATTEAHVNNSTLHPYFLAQHLESYLILHSLRKNPEPTDPTFSQQVFSTSDSTSSLKELWFAACAPRTGLSSGRMPKQKRIRQGQRGCRH